MKELLPSWLAPGANVWRELGAAAAAFLLVFGILCPANQWVHFPVHHDDFSNLAATGWSEAAARIGFTVRPVSHIALGFLSAAGMPAYFGALSLLTIVYTWLSVRVALLLFPGAPPPWLLLGAAASASLAFENAIEWLKNTGLITNLLSGFGGMACAALLLAPRERALRTLERVGLWTFAAASFWSKEDFVLPVLLVAAYAALLARRQQPSRWRDALVTLAGLVAIALLVALYNRMLDSTFTQARAGVYAPDFHPVSILRTAWAYLSGSPARLAVLALQAAMLAWSLAAGARVERRAVLLWLVLIGALVLPYACLPHHTADYYALNWFPLQAAGSIVLLWRLRPAGSAVAAAAVCAALLLYLSATARNSIASWYATMALRNRAIIALIETNRERLRPYRTVVIEGDTVVGPWFAANGDLLARRFGLAHEWLVFSPADSEYHQRSLAVLGPVRYAENGRVSHRVTGRDPLPAGAPVVRLQPDGTGVVEFPKE